MATATKTKPVHTIRQGMLKAAIWANETQNGTRHNVTLVRIYKDGDDWKESSSLGRDDLLRGARILQLASDWIFEHGSRDDS